MQIEQCHFQELGSFLLISPSNIFTGERSENTLKHGRQNQYQNDTPNYQEAS